MKYDFDRMTDRRGVGSLKWDVPERELPMWVADMDFETAPEIIEALKKRVEHGIFGYSVVTEDWYEAYRSWWSRRHHLEMEKEWLIFCTGIVPAISSAVRKLTTVGENVLVQTPVYNIFFNSIRNNGRNILESPLVYRDGEYSVDFGDLEEKLANPQTTLMLLCNPHNPVGKIWDRETLFRIGELCAKHHVLVLSDEIHCDLTDPGYEYVPFASVSQACRDNSITCLAPTKTFNIAGLQTAAVMVPNPVIRHKLDRGLNTDEVAEPNAFAVGAAVAAFQKGEEWLEELREYLSENKRRVREFAEKNLSGIKVVPSRATYLLWLDCSGITEDAGELTAFIRRDSGLYLTEGEEYGACGKAFIRLNPACPRERLLDGMRRLEESVRRFTGKNGKE
ncbi:pyridoxal phosphate-dependent aminotransferase [Acetatifactor muris]|uniref:cysteine-S-conjugate beta-lyase n=1 Tax=Acetatifactor muris TaxID=879566 RepID=A0A2K4ZN83_9FIRM|nr:MalY/PatB family protein [Acetatifactor muris]MCI8801592.1 pyridoxal phosphate-dependent aminotransferase [Lachnospiraceae bacterium]MCR2050304.1 pyridoxal phosphate-dependent aminotransferase [Acetatifactor muris]SOY31938.1 Cystathionine beta-lyase PatB [Acetatifactor muris]